MKDSVTILGAEYQIEKRAYNEDPLFKKQDLNGYCDGRLRKIVIGDLTTFEENNFYGKEWIEVTEKQILRHEIVHAFLYESGLDSCAFSGTESWAYNEEMVDWIALQGTKIYEAWRFADAI